MPLSEYATEKRDGIDDQTFLSQDQPSKQPSVEFNPCLHTAPVPMVGATRGFGQMFGLHPAAAGLTIIVDSMLFGGELATWGASIVFSIIVSIGIGAITFGIQKRWYRDSDDDALIKAVILMLLTMIPTNIPAFAYVPAGVVGFFHNLGNGKKEKQIADA